VQGDESLDNMLFTTIIGSAAGILGTGLGGAIGFFLNDPGKRFLSTLLSFAAGLMIAVVCFDLLPEAFEIGGLITGMVGIVLGTAMVVVLDEMISGLRKRRNPRKKKTSFMDAGYIRTGILLTIGIAIHNFPEGLAIGSGFTAIQSYGLGLSLVIALHDIPEGIAMATPMRIGGVGKTRVFLLSLLAGIPTGIGALVGYILGEISPVFIAMCLAFAGGAMLYITCSELMPDAFELYRGRISSFGLIMGAMTGILISSLI